MILKKIKLDYDLRVFLDADYSVHKGSCISYQRREQTDIHHGLGDGFPDSYHEDNTRIQQIWFTEEQVDYVELGKQLGIEVITVSAILQPPGNIITLHRDTFFQISKRYPTDTRIKVRANIYLKDWEVGHIIHYKDLNEEWQTNTHWTNGEGLLWDSDILHIGANIGLKDKYTLQISGFLVDNDLNKPI